MFFSAGLASLLQFYNYLINICRRLGDTFISLANFQNRMSVAAFGLTLEFVSLCKTRFPICYTGEGREIQERRKNLVRFVV